MGTNTLTGRTDGEVIPAADHNELVTALGGDFVPRNNSAVPEDIFGQLGTSALRWLRAYLKACHIGTAANNLIIDESVAGELWLRNPTNESIRLRNGKIDCYVNNALVSRLDLATNEFFIAGTAAYAMTSSQHTFRIGGVSTVTFDSITMGTPIKYIDYDSLKHNDKVITGEFTAAMRGDYGATPFTATINNCVSGKKLFIEIGGSWSNQIGEAMELIVYVNGVDVVSTSAVNYLQGIRHVYTIPSSGNYSVTMDYRDGGIQNTKFLRSDAALVEVSSDDAGFYKIQEL